MSLIKLLSMILMLFIIASFTSFDLKTPLIDHSRGLEGIKSPEELADSLASTNRATRASAIIQLTILRNQGSVPALIYAYNSEPIIPASIVDAGPALKYLILRALGQIGGPESYIFLKRFLYELPAHSREIRETEGDSYSIFCGLFDALARLEPADSAEIYYKIYDQSDLDHFIRQFAYETHERIELKNAKFRTYQDTIFYLLNTSKSIDMKNKLDSSLKHTPEFIKMMAIRYLVAEYGIQDTTVFSKYKLGLTGSDAFNSEIDFIQTLSKSKMISQQQNIRR